MTQGAGVPLTDAELREALSAMHKGLITMQARLDDHEKVFKVLMQAMDSIILTTKGKRK